MARVNLKLAPEPLTETQDDVCEILYVDEPRVKEVEAQMPASERADRERRKRQVYRLGETALLILLGVTIIGLLPSWFRLGSEAALSRLGKAKQGSRA